MQIYASKSYIYGYLKLSLLQSLDTEFICYQGSGQQIQMYQPSISTRKIQTNFAVNGKLCSNPGLPYCCPWLIKDEPRIICENKENCTIQCSQGGCSNVLVDAQSSDTVTVYCDKDECRNSIVY